MHTVLRVARAVCCILALACIVGVGTPATRAAPRTQAAALDPTAGSGPGSTSTTPASGPTQRAPSRPSRPRRPAPLPRDVELQPGCPHPAARARRSLPRGRARPGPSGRRLVPAGVSQRRPRCAPVACGNHVQDRVRPQFRRLRTGHRVSGGQIPGATDAPSAARRGRTSRSRRRRLPPRCHHPLAARSRALADGLAAASPTKASQSNSTSSYR